MTELAAKDYFSPAAKLGYMSASQYQAFCKCEAGALAEVKGEWVQEATPAMLIGSYVDAALLGGLEDFKAEAGERLFTKSGDLKADFRQAECLVERVRKDEMFIRYLSGDTQVVATGEIAGVPFRGKIDVYHRKGVIVDLKTCASFAPVWSDEEKCKVSFVEAWGYDTQLAIYQWLHDKSARCFIAAVTKEKEPDLAIIEVDQERLDFCLSMVGERATHFQAIKEGRLVPTRCEKCDYCKSTKKLRRIVDYREVGK